jgi:hypothetical protein
MPNRVNCRYPTFLWFITFACVRALFNDEQDPPSINHKDLPKRGTNYAVQITYPRAISSPREMKESKFLLVATGCEEFRY